MKRFLDFTSFSGPSLNYTLKWKLLFFTENEKFFMSSTASRVRVEWVFFYFEENLLAESWKDWEKESPIWCFDDVLSLSRAHDLLVLEVAQRSGQMFSKFIYMISCVLRCEKKQNKREKMNSKEENIKFITWMTLCESFRAMRKISNRNYYYRLSVSLKCVRCSSPSSNV